eukprot:EG_transcript_22062
MSTALGELTFTEVEKPSQSQRGQRRWVWPLLWFCMGVAVTALTVAPPLIVLRGKAYEPEDEVFYSVCFKSEEIVMSIVRNDTTVTYTTFNTTSGREVVILQDHANQVLATAVDGKPESTTRFIAAALPARAFAGEQVITFQPGEQPPLCPGMPKAMTAKFATQGTFWCRVEKCTGGSVVCNSVCSWLAWFPFCQPVCKAVNCAFVWDTC